MKRLHLIVGEDKELTLFYLNNIIEKIKDNNIIEYDLNDSNMNDILDEASIISMFSDGKIIVGRNFNLSKVKEEELDYLKRYIDNTLDNVYIILICDKIDARVKEYKIFKDNFEIINIKDTNNIDNINLYVSNYIKDNCYKIDKSNIEYFISKVGCDINNINLELNKLFMYKIDDKVINRDDIDLLIEDNIDSIIYEFTNAVLDKDYNKISKMYNNFKLNGVGYDYLLVSLANCFRQSLIIKILYNTNKSNYEIAKEIGKKEFFVKKSLERLYNYTEDDLCLMISKLGLIDRNFKSGKDNIDMLELFLLGK